jgi:hypothetical protein
MAISVNFGGSTIYRPGAYSTLTIDRGGNFALGAAGLVGLIGEADEGEPGSAVQNIANNVYTADQFAALKAKYGSGPIVDAAKILFTPGADGAIPAGAQAVYVYKTNASVRAQFTPVPLNWGTVRSRVYGTRGNLFTWRNTLGAETPASTTGTVAVAPAAVDFANTQTLTIAINGGLPTTHTITTSVNRAALLTQLNGAFPGLSFTANSNNFIVITMAPGTNIHRDGAGRSFEIVGGTAVPTFGWQTGLYTPAVEPQAALQLRDTQNAITESETVGGNIALTIGFRAAANDATAATVTISATQVTLTVTGGAQAGTVNLSISDYPTIATLAEAINLLPKVNGEGWRASPSTALAGLAPTKRLDRVLNVGALTRSTAVTPPRPARIKTDAYAVRNFFELSQLAELVTGTNSFCGLPDAQTEVALSGGAKGGTTSASITAALEKFESIRLNSVVPLFSRNATDDIADALTDASSTYTIDGIWSAVKSHCILMSQTKKRSERQGYLSIKDTYTNCKTKIADITYERLQVCIQDIRVVNGNGEVVWLQPWAGACLLAGARGGSAPATPLTFKYYNILGIRQTGQPMTTPAASIVEDFNPDTQAEDAIIAGVTFWTRPQTGGFRLELDNTTYTKDNNWVLNRANVLYAADLISFSFRTTLESIYVGAKNTVSAAEVKGVCQSILLTYLAQGLTVSTQDAPGGFKDLIVQINGNTIEVSVTLKLVEGIDFVLLPITVQRATSAA